MDRSKINREHGSFKHLTEIMDRSNVYQRLWIVQTLTEIMNRSNINRDHGSPKHLSEIMDRSKNKQR